MVFQLTLGANKMFYVAVGASKMSNLNLRLFIYDVTYKKILFWHA